jgi:hypothetical protein
VKARRFEVEQARESGEKADTTASAENEIKEGESSAQNQIAARLRITAAAPAAASLPPYGARLLPAQQLGSLAIFAGDPPRLILREQLGLNVRFTPESGHC